VGQAGAFQGIDGWNLIPIFGMLAQCFEQWSDLDFGFWNLDFGL
jgi:hypothetical protein